MAAWRRVPRTVLALAGALLAALAVWAAPGSDTSSPSGEAPASQGAPSRTDGPPAFLPAEATTVLTQIQRGGPFDHPQDGGVFQNRERLLPEQPRGYYREYTVEAPGSADRGARRIITGGDPPRDYFYTADHYRSFRAFTIGRSR